jgi:NAD(P)-dependent dehydrogenase (short-subunit alcohol dehydrogenase family)
VDINQGGLDRMTSELASEGHRIFSFVGDVTDEDFVRSIARDIEINVGAVSALVNNVGISPPSQLLHEIEFENWKRVIDVNLHSYFLFTKYILPQMISVGKSSIVNIASILGVVGFAPELLSQSAYAAAKAGVIGLTKQTAADYGSLNVRCNAVAAGWHLDTELGKSGGNFQADEQKERLQKFIKERTPLGRSGGADEIAALVLFLLSDASSFITGAVIAQDGGWTAQ